MEQGPDELEGDGGQGSDEAERAADLERLTGTPLGGDGSESSTPSEQQSERGGES